MPNLRGASPVGRDDGGRLYAARASSRVTRGQAEQDWDAGRSRQTTYDRSIVDNAFAAGGAPRGWGAGSRAAGPLSSKTGGWGCRGAGGGHKGVD